MLSGSLSHSGKGTEKEKEDHPEGRSSHIHPALRGLPAKPAQFLLQVTERIWQGGGIGVT